eukprot:Trichotokara_eunicae@DN10062_c0_g1_i1.p1
MNEQEPSQQAREEYKLFGDAFDKLSIALSSCPVGENLRWIAYALADVNNSLYIDNRELSFMDCMGSMPTDKFLVASATAFDVRSANLKLITSYVKRILTDEKELIRHLTDENKKVSFKDKIK